MTDAIILNRMYVGDYLGENIGHEVINLMKADNNNNYIYINPYGKVNDNFYNSKWETKAIILTRWSKRKNNSNKTISFLEVLAVATGVSLWEDEKLKKDTIGDLIKEKIIREQDKNNCATFGDVKNFISESEKIHQLHNMYLKQESVTYGEKKLEDIFQKNTGNNKSLYVTFKTTNIKKVAKNKHIYLTDNAEDKRELDALKDDNSIVINVNKDTPNTKYKLDSNGDYIKDKNGNNKIETNFKLNFSKQSLKQYIINGKNNKKNLEKVYENIRAIYTESNYKEFWDEDNTTKTYKDMTNEENKGENFYIEKISNNTNFIEIIKKDYDELAYSNLFYYMFKTYPKLFYEFAKAEDLDPDNGGLGIDERELSINEIEVMREEGNIDLLINYPTQKTLIVIENKIKSGINGVRQDKNGNETGNQLSKYVHYTYGYRVKKNSSKTVYEYKEFTNEEKEIKLFGGKERNNYNRKYYLFVPKYYNLTKEFVNKNVKEFVKNAKKLNDFKEEYKIVNYKKIYNFFNKYYIDESKKPKYYNEFLYALKIHSYDVDNTQERQMFKRFFEKIETS